MRHLRTVGSCFNVHIEHLFFDFKDKLGLQIELGNTADIDRIHHKIAQYAYSGT